LTNLNDSAYRRILQTTVIKVNANLIEALFDAMLD